MAAAQSSGFEPPTQQVTFATHSPGVGMTHEHYVWVQRRLKDEIKGNHASSIWLALAIGVAGVGASLLVTVMSATLSDATKGKLEVACWASLVAIVLLVVFHFITWKDSDRRAGALIEEMDLHRFEVVVPPDRSDS
jgi:hypothetical protein